MSFDATHAVGEIAAQYPLATRVFHRRGIDYCCGGGIPLAEACKKEGVDVELVVSEIERELADSPANAQRWDDAKPAELIDHILTVYHVPLKEELPRLLQMAAKVHSVHGEKDPERLAELHKVVEWLATELEQHLVKEEEDLFPLILKGDKEKIRLPVDILESEHSAAGEALRRVRVLTDDFQVPAEACNTWRALWKGLEALEDSLHQHIHLENNILFPKAV